MAISDQKLNFFAARHPMEKCDAVPLAAIVAVFTFFALFQLGDTSAPQSFFQFTSERNSITIELQEPEELSGIMYYTGLWTGDYVLEVSYDGAYWYEHTGREGRNPGDPRIPAMNQTHADLFKWRYALLDLDFSVIRYIRLTSLRTPLELGELAIFGTGGELIPASRISSPQAPELFDEQELIPIRPMYMNSMYFDEIYHGRTAFEFLRGEAPYETTHPPLGKVIIAASVNTFGMTPFGWRFIGAVLGVVMLLVMYIFIKNIFGNTIVATCATLLFGFDFMRFVQTRIATIDTYGVLFILLAYFFMYRYVTTPTDAPFRKSLVPLALSGVAFGLGCASKWIVVYAGVGLAVIYTIRLVQLAKHYNENGMNGLGSYITKTILYSVLFYGFVPFAIYYLSYIPFAAGLGWVMDAGSFFDPGFHRGYSSIVWENQLWMFSYHSELVAEHPFSSTWWQWILNSRPILYVNNHFDNMRSTFSAFGNPIVWWGGFIAMIVMVVRVAKYHDGKALFILIGYLSQLVPWIPVSRLVFIYHYFPSTLFLVLAFAHLFNTIIERAQPKHKVAVYGYTAVAGALFAKFYPGLTGIPMSHAYFNFLRWFPGHWSY